MTYGGKAAGAVGERVGEGDLAAGARPATMRDLGGSGSDAFNRMIARQIAAALYFEPGNGEDRLAKAEASLAVLVSVAPRNELEGMLGAQLVACHNAAMECFRRAAQPAEGPQMRNENLAHAGRLSRAYAALVDALDRRRGESSPKTVVLEQRIVRDESGLQARAAQRSSSPLASVHTHAPTHTHTSKHTGN